MAITGLLGGLGLGIPEFLEELLKAEDEAKKQLVSETIGKKEEDGKGPSSVVLPTGKVVDPTEGEGKQEEKLGMQNQKLQDRLPQATAPAPLQAPRPPAGSVQPFARQALNPLEQIANVLTLGGYGQGAGQRRTELEGIDAKNATYNALINKQGLPPELAKAVVSNPEVMKQVLLGFAGPKGAPTILELPGQYGTPGQKVVLDSTTGNVTPLADWLKARGAPQAAGPGFAQKTAPISVPAAEATPTFGTTTVTPATPSPIPAVTGAPPLAPVIAPPVAPTLGVAPTVAPPAGTVVGAGVPKPPEGYVHKASPDGKGFLWDQATGQPIFISKSEEAAHAKGTEKKVLEQVDKEEQIAGVGNLIASARNMVKSPQFERGLGLALYGADLPFVGQVNPVAGVGKIFNRNDPALPVSDDIQNLQSQLNLVVGRAYLKGQGQVSNFERSMVSDAIGKLGSATSSADFLMRLNTVEHMIKDLNSGKKLENADQYSRRPTQQEINDLFEERPTGLVHYQGTLDELSKKYKVDPENMLQYAQNIYDYGRKKKK